MLMWWVVVYYPVILMLPAVAEKIDEYLGPHERRESIVDWGFAVFMLLPVILIPGYMLVQTFGRGSP